LFPWTLSNPLAVIHLSIIVVFASSRKAIAMLGLVEKTGSKPRPQDGLRL